MFGSRGGFTPRFELMVGGEAAGYTNSVSGGGLGGELVKVDPSSYHLQSMTTVGLKYEPFSAEIALGMSRHMIDWIAASVEQRKPQPKSGHLIVGDPSGKGVCAADFEAALIAEIGFPDCDAENEKTTGFCKIKFDPTYTEWRSANGYSMHAPLGSAMKSYIPSKFNFELQGLQFDQAVKIAGFTFKQEVVANPCGRRSYPEKIPGKPEIPQFTVEVSVNEDNMSGFLRWCKEHLVDGGRYEHTNLNGSLAYLGPDEKSLGELDLYSVGLTKYEPLEVKGGANKSWKWKLHLYVEDIKLRLKEFGGADRSAGQYA